MEKFSQVKKFVEALDHGFSKVDDSFIVLPLLKHYQI